jgi:AcrR family transcriptional regulator
MAAPGQNPPPAANDARILDIAADHVRRHGIERTTIVSIAKAAGMSHANIYRYFASKEALVEALSAQWLKPVERGLRDIANSADPAYDKIERMLAAVHRAYRTKLDSDPAVFGLFAAAAREGRDVATRHAAVVLAELRGVVEEGMAGGVFAGDVARATALVADAGHRFLHPVVVEMDARLPRAQIDARFERVSRLIVRALASGIR